MLYRGYGFLLSGWFDWSDIEEEEEEKEEKND